MKIALIAGHDSFSMQGAVANGVTENKFWNDFLVELLPCLPTKHTYKIFHRPNQKHLGYRKAVTQLHKDIEHWGADLDVEMHFNASGNLSVKGHEVLYYKTSRSGRKYAQLLNELFTKSLGTRNRHHKGVLKNSRGGYQLYIGKNPSILTEAFFGTSEIDKFLPNGSLRPKLLQSFVTFFTKI